MAVSNSLTQTTKKTGLTAYLNQSAVKGQIESILGSKRGTAFITSIVAAVQNNPTLSECSNSSILSAALLGESLNLSPSNALMQYFLIPFNNKKTGIKEAQFQLGAAGYRALAMRSNQYADIDFIEVHEGEYKGRDKFTGKQKFEFIEDEVEREKLPVVGYLAYFELVNGFRKSVYWTKQKVIEHANRYSQSFNADIYYKIQEGKIPQSEMWKYSSPWYTSFSAMAEKTLIKHLLSKYGILSTDLVTAVTSDDAVIREDGTPDYVEMEEVTVSTAKKEEPIMPPPVEKKPEGGAPETPEEAATIAGALFK
jgi:recombination protein RecT